MARALPTGTVTFLFTDIEGSTRLLAELGAERYAELLAAHRGAVRSALERNGGVELGTEGDAFFVSFDDAGRAVAAAREAQEALAETSVRVRMGLHSGEPMIGDEGYVGIDVHRAARICATAHGGQVVLSARTRALAGSGQELVDLGLHRLKDLGEPERLFQLGSAQFPPLRSLNVTNLPAQPDALIGREREVAEVAALVAGTRLVTLTGSGGSGKTRLGLQTAAELVDSFPDGVFWVPLAAVSEPELVLPSIGAALGARGDLFEHIEERRMLLLLDNFEQMLGAAPDLSSLLGRCPGLHLLVTSRAPLRIEGEHDYQVEPLGDPDAAALFRVRAADAEPEEVVLEICRRVDCLPLAVELAAARTRLLPPPALLERLGKRLPLLTTGRRDAPERQRTLRAAIEWSYALLLPAEQAAFRRLGVFADSFDHAAAKEVATVDLDTLQSLADNSLLRTWGCGRLGFLETVREFALDALESEGSAEALRRRHFEWYLALAGRANLSDDDDRPQRHTLLDHEDANLRAALDWALSAGEIEAGVRLASSLEHWWIARNPFVGSRTLQLLLADREPLPPGVLARGLRVWAECTFIVGRFDEGARLFEQSLAICRELGDEAGVGLLLQRLAIWEQGWNEQGRGNLARARSLAEEALTLLRRAGSRSGELQALGTLGDIDLAEGRRDRGVERLEQSAALAADVGHTWWRAWTLTTLTEQAVLAERWDDAARWGQEALTDSHSIRERQLLVYLLALLARTAAATGRTERAGVLWGAVETEEARGPVGQWEGERAKYAKAMLAAAGPEFDRGRAAGRALSLDEAVEYALEKTASTA
jgi:predicted ATPase/class 3 adenylate cyclase